MGTQGAADQTHEPSQDVGRLVNTVSHQLKRQMHSHEAEDSLTNMQRHVLYYILFQSLKRDIYQKDIEKEFQIRRSTATGVLQLLEKNGFIHREPVKRDARLKRVVPTDKAEGVREYILGNIRYTEALLRKGIPEEKLKVCMEVLGQMSANLAENEKAAGCAGAENAKNAGCTAVENLSGNRNHKRGDNRP